MRICFRTCIVSGLTALAATATARGDEPSSPAVEIVGLWRFDDDADDDAGSWSSFSGYERSAISKETVQTGAGSYAAVHGDRAGSDWQEQATGKIQFGSGARLQQPREVGIALWVHPVDQVHTRGRLISYGADAAGLEAIADQPEGRYRFVNTGLMQEGDSPALELPTGQWSHVALTADGEQVSVVLNGEVVATVKQTGPLKTDDALYLGATAGGKGLLSTYIDELIVARGPANADWAKGIFASTRGGEPLAFETPPLPAFEAAPRDLTKFLRISPEQLEIPVGKPTKVRLTIRETPLVGVYVAPKQMTMESQVYDIIRDLKEHQVNAVILRLDWCIERAPLLELFHKNDFRIFIITKPPYGQDLVVDVPDTARRDREGNTLGTASFCDPRYVEHVRKTFLAEGVAGRGIDGIIIDEPALRGWKEALKTGNLYDAHPAERAAFQRMYGEPYPQIDVKADQGSAKWEKVMAFRRQIVLDWLGLLKEVAQERAPGVAFHVNLTPDAVGRHRGESGMKSADSTAIDVDALLKTGWLDGIHVDPYLNAYGKQPEWVANFLPIFKDSAHERGVGSYFWVQAYMESPKHVKRGFHAGDVGEVVRMTLGSGSDGVFIWFYRGFKQDGYTWDDYFKEVTAAAQPSLDRAAEGVRFDLVEANDAAVREVRPVGRGEYEVTLHAPAAGDLTLRVTNRVGIERDIPITVGTSQGAGR